jgi:hypothetical protein
MASLPYEACANAHLTNRRYSDLSAVTDGTLKNLPDGRSDAPERKINCRAPLSIVE